ncbi:MAG: type II 3-dehydroquinate dehydratase [Clostridiales Family XIII bacterium]|jgi:3-dehydroquinate dehydratase-2|nr:type II 3-dehydroquinate dehydratase [Clostridiales Family XIII bacterium]
MKQILVINGPNMNMLGRREPEKYGSATLDEINAQIAEKAEAMGMECEFFQSNYEGEIVAVLQNSEDYDGVVLNAAAYSHYSVAIRDAVAATPLPVVETHMTNIYAREGFRRESVLSAVCDGCIAGFGADSYVLALRALEGILGA